MIAMHTLIRRMNELNRAIEFLAHEHNKQIKSAEIDIRSTDHATHVSKKKDHVSSVINRFHHTGDVGALIMSDHCVGATELRFDLPWNELSKEAQINRIVTFAVDHKQKCCIINEYLANQLKVEYSPIECKITKIKGLVGPHENGSWTIVRQIIHHVIRKNAVLTFL